MFSMYGTCKKGQTMAKVEYELDENVAVVTMNDGENRFNPPFIRSFMEVLDEIESSTGAGALVVTSSDSKIWSNGIDLNWLLPAVEKEGNEILHAFLTELFGLMKRVLLYPMPTIAAINGHAFAGGAFLSFAHDFRFMRSDRGWICMPEIDLGMALTPVFVALSKRAVPMYLFEEMQYTARRLTAQECEEHHIIKKACPLEALMEEALAFAKPLKKDREVIRKMKMETHDGALEVIEREIAFHAARKQSDK